MIKWETLVICDLWAQSYSYGSIFLIVCSQISYQARCHCVLDGGVHVGGVDLDITRQSINTCVLIDLLCDRTDIFSLYFVVDPPGISFVPSNIWPSDLASENRILTLIGVRLSNYCRVPPNYRKLSKWKSCLYGLGSQMSFTQKSSHWRVSSLVTRVPSDYRSKLGT